MNWIDYLHVAYVCGAICGVVLLACFALDNLLALWNHIAASVWRTRDLINDRWNVDNYRRLQEMERRTKADAGVAQQ